MRLKLALFDLDGTLKQVRDPYVYLHQRLGTWEQSQEFFQMGLEGHISYAEWLRRDAELWAGQPVERIIALFRANPYVPGAREVLRALQQAGVTVALISTGLTLHAELVRSECGLEYAFANEVLVAGGRLTGEAVERVPEGGKGAIADRLMAELGVPADALLAVGDSTSDIALFERAGVSVAVNPSSDEVRAAADIVLEKPDLRPLLPRLAALLTTDCTDCTDF
ncbi:MAG: HAD family phosphatase [Chloroflexi bacterium]|nr:HAD family phosphatase [Chloroflexota bacterium]